MIYQPDTHIFCHEFDVTLRWKIGVDQGKVASGFKWGCAKSFGAASFGSSTISLLLFISLVWNFFYCCTNLLLIWILEEFQIPANIFATGRNGVNGLTSKSSQMCVLWWGELGPILIRLSWLGSYWSRSFDRSNYMAVSCGKQGVEIQLGLAIENVKASVAVKRRLACEQVKYWLQVNPLFSLKPYIYQCSKTLSLHPFLDEIYAVFIIIWQ